MASLLKSTLTYIPGILAPRVSAYLVIIIFTRLFAPDEFGIYALIITYGEALDAIFMNWSRLGMLRFLKKDSGRHEGGLVRASLTIFLASLLAGLAGAALLSLTVRGSTPPILFFCSLSLYLSGNAAMRFGLTILRASGRDTVYSMLEVIRPTVSFAGIFIMISLTGLSYTSLVLGFFGPTAIFGLITMLAVTGKHRHTSPDWQRTRQMLRYALPLVLTFLLSSIIRTTDRYMLNALSGTAVVGLYAASYALARPALELLFNAINLGAFPRLVDLYETQGGRSATGHLGEILATQLYFGVPMVAGIAILAEPVAEIMLGQEYRQAAPILMPLIAATGLVAGIKAFTFDQVFHLKQRPMTLNGTLLAAAVVNILLNVYLIRRFGIYGVAWATLLAYLLALALSMLLAGRLLPVQLPCRETGIIITATLGMSVALMVFLPYSPENAILRLSTAVPAGAAIYFLTTLLLGSRIMQQMVHAINHARTGPR